MNAEGRRNVNGNVKRRYHGFHGFELRNDTDTAITTARTFVRTYRVKIAAAYRLGRSSAFAVAVPNAAAVDVSVSFSPFKIR